jgi:methionine-rich copper-binding protein CopC
LIVRWKRSGCVAAAASAFLTGCAGNGIGLDQSGRPLPPGGGTGGALTADFASIQDHVFTPICTVCHAGGSAPQGLRLDATNSYALLVGVPSTEVPAILRVKPGDPDNSYLIQKLEGHASVGAQMPFGGPPLAAEALAVIRQWILDGAMQAAAAAAAAAAASGSSFAVVAVTPAMHDVLSEAPARMVIAFNQDLDQTRIDESSMRLEQVVPGGGASVRVTLVVPPGNVRALVIEPAQPLPVGVYRLAVPAPPETGLASLDGERLGGTAADGSAVVITEFEVTAQP